MQFEGRKGCQGGLSKVTHEQRFDVRTCFKKSRKLFLSRRHNRGKGPDTA